MTFPVSHHAAITSLALAIVAPSAFAGDIAQTTLTPVIVTATRMPQAASDVLSDNILIGPEEIKRSGAGSLIDLLQRQRGIEVVRNGGAGTSSSVSIRGADNKQNIVLVDGVRIGSSTSGGANWSAIPLSAIDHVEIVYGPLSTLYGSDAVGGVIQIFTKKGASAPHMSAFAGAGSYATRQADAGIAGGTGGEHNFSYALSVSKEESAGFSARKPDYLIPSKTKFNPDNDGYDKESANGQFALQLAKNHEVGLLFMHSKLDSQYDNTGTSYDARLLQRLDNIAVFAKDRFLPDWASHLQVAQARDKATNLATATSKNNIGTTQTDITWQNDILVGTDMLQILFDYRKEEVRTSPTPFPTTERNTRSVAASYNLKRDRHLGSISVRNDDSSQFGGNTTGALGYGYRISNSLRANANFGTSFRAPTFNDLYFPKFGQATNQPEKGRNTEAGLYFDNGGAQFSAAYYHNLVENLLVNAGSVDCPPGFTSGCAKNVGKALLEGLSLSVRRQLGDINLRGNLDLQNPHDQSTGNLLIRRAKKHANFAAEYSNGSLTGGAELQLSGKRFEDAANKTALGGYSLLNLFVTCQVAPDWSLLARLNNVTNKKYELAKLYDTAGANAFLGLRYMMK